MARYVNADDIKNAIDGVTRNYLSTLSTTDAIDNVTAKWLYKRLRTLVDEMPTTDVAPFRCGQWEERIIDDESPLFQRRFYCSCCGRWTTYGKTEYCPHCGAKMDGEIKNEE